MARNVVLAALMALLAGCKDGVGEGAKPSELYLGISARAGSIEVPECTAQQLTAFVVFDGAADGELSDFTSRVQWRSVDPTTVFVGDGVTPSPDGVVFGPGYIVARKAGTAVVAADYLDFSASITIEVKQAEAITITPVLTDIAENIQQKFYLKARFQDNSSEQDISSIAQWRFAQATARASVDADGSGIVAANSAADSELLQLVAELPECGRTVTTQFRVSPVAGLEIDYEHGADALLPLAYSEALSVYARFNPQAGETPTRQNLSAVVDVDNVFDDLIVVQRGDEALYVTALAEDPGSANLDLTLDDTALKIQTRTWQLQDIPLLSLRLDADELRIRAPATGQLHVLGLFEDGIERDITRHVQWTSTDASIATVSSAYDSAGEVTIGDVDQDAEVTAYSSDVEDQDQALATATIKAFSSSSEELQ